MTLILYFKKIYNHTFNHTFNTFLKMSKKILEKEARYEQTIAFLLERATLTA